MGRSRELSDFEHGLVIGCNMSKKSVRDTASLPKLPKSTAGDVIVKWKCEDTTTTKPRLGRLRLMTDRDRLVSRKLVCETCWISSETIAHDFHSAMNCPSSTMIVCPELRGMGFHG
jgi:hypothetical protein